MKRKIFSVIFVLIVSISISCVTPAMASNINFVNESNVTVDIPSSDQLEPRSVTPYLWKAAFKLTKWVIVKADNLFFNREPTIIDKGVNWAASSSGSVAFGNGSDKARRVKFTNKVTTTHNMLDAFAQTSVTGWLDTITVFIENSKGNEVNGGQVTHNQHIFTDNNVPIDTYTTYYVYGGNRKWDCWFYQYDFSEEYKNSRAVNADIDMVYNPATQKSYVIPSDAFAMNTINLLPQGNEILTSQDLVNEFQDEKLSCSVNRMKNYNIGDSVYVKDNIADLVYDDDKNTTVMYFGSTEESCFFWPFAGDLRRRFNIGDEITFKFNVVEEYSTDEYTFETLDYFLESYDLINQGTAANIDDYLVR